MSHPAPAAAWVALAAVFLAALVADLVGHARGRGASTRAAACWLAGWVGVAVAFGAAIAVWLGRRAAVDYVGSYLVEQSLSLDNLCAFLLVFAELRIAPNAQRRVLFWGILGALVTRGAFIGCGVAVLHRWHAAVVVLGALLVVSAATALRANDSGGARLGSWLAAHLPVATSTPDGRFVAREGGRLLATRALVALVTIETADVFFSVDSIPAAFGVTRSVFILYASNILAVAALRALYVVAAGALSHVARVKYAVTGLLGFFGVKLLIEPWVRVPAFVSVAATALVLFAVLLAAWAPCRRRGAGLKDEQVVESTKTVARTRSANDS